MLREPREGGSEGRLQCDESLCRQLVFEHCSFFLLALKPDLLQLPVVVAIPASVFDRLSMQNRCPPMGRCSSAMSRQSPFELRASCWHS